MPLKSLCSLTRWSRKGLPLVHKKIWDRETVFFSEESTFAIINQRGQKVWRPSCTIATRRALSSTWSSPWAWWYGPASADGGWGPISPPPPRWQWTGPVHGNIGWQTLTLHGHSQQNLLPPGQAPCYTSRKVMAVLIEKRISVTDWPGSSPDLNPNEDL